MQTFLPYASFVASAKCLDNKRLGKQRVECLQILKTLKIGEYQCKYCKRTYIESDKCCPSCNGITEHRCQPRKTPWFNHPIVQMWKGYERALVVYGGQICVLWASRGFNDTVLDTIADFMDFKASVQYPNWLGNEEFHLSHQSNLVRKYPEHYRKFFPNVPDDLPYQWYNQKTKEWYTI